VTSQPGPIDAYDYGYEAPKQMPGGLLHSLENVTSLTITQSWPKCLELLGCWEFKNHYSVADQFGNHLMLCKEESSCMSRLCCNNSRPFEMSVMDKFENEVLRFDRPLRCMFCPLPCFYPSWMQSLNVTTQGGMFLGRIQEPALCCDIGLEVFEGQSQEKKYYINGNICEYFCRCCQDVDYPILNNSGVEVATLTWKFRGLCQEVMTDSDTFVLKFNGPMPSQDKALLIGATILMDFMYYEHNGDNGGG